MPSLVQFTDIMGRKDGGQDEDKDKDKGEGKKKKKEKAKNKSKPTKNNSGPVSFLSFFLFTLVYK